MKFIKQYAVYAALLVLGACANIDTPSKGLLVAQETYNSTVNAAADYAEWKRCPQPAGQKCSEQAVVDQLVIAADDADAILDNAWEVVRAGGNPDALTIAIDAATRAVDVLLSILTNHGVQVGEGYGDVIEKDFGWQRAGVPPFISMEG